MSSYQLLLFDMDGTLLTEDRRISDENLFALQSLMRAGVRVGLATGRSLRSVQPYLEILRPNGPLILFNGARVWDQDERKFVHEENLPIEEALLALELVRGYEDTHANLYVDHDILISRRTERSVISEVKDGVPHTVVGDLADWLRANPRAPVKIMFISDPERVDRLGAELRSKARQPVSLIRSEAEYLELTREGVNKGSAMQALERFYGIPRSAIMAFGDNLNDLEMIRSSGLGVAMGNAHEQLKAVANRVIGPHTGNAIQGFLKEVFSAELQS